jgi:hypothetical protein
MSESRLLHAKPSGFCIVDLDLLQNKYAEMICQFSLEPERIVTRLRLHGVPWDNFIYRNAAYFGKLNLLQWLHSNDCQWDEYTVLLNASRSGSVPVLEWLATVAAP